MLAPYLFIIPTIKISNFSLAISFLHLKLFFWMIQFSKMRCLFLMSVTSSRELSAENFSSWFQILSQKWVHLLMKSVDFYYVARSIIGQNHSMLTMKISVIQLSFITEQSLTKRRWIQFSHIFNSCAREKKRLVTSCD